MTFLTAFMATGAEPTVPPAAPDSARYFNARIAPLLARHCLECHDSTTRKGKLDLSQKITAFGKSKHGHAIVPGNSAKSLVWESVEADEMPEDRPVLSAEEKRLLREWIDAGAHWFGDRIEADAIHRDRRAALNLVRRLTVPEYIATVKSAVGVDIADDARRLLPPDVRADGFSNTAYNLNTDLGHVEAHARLSQIIVERMDAPKFARSFEKSTKLDDPAMRNLIAAMGGRLLRGPLDEQEIDAFLRIPRAVAADGGGFDDAAALLLEAMLQSPRFIYRMEKQSGDGTRRRLNSHELGSRLSYLVWGAPPDEELMRAADAGELADNARVEAQVRRMLADPRAVGHSAQFIREWLDLDRLENLQPDKKLYPKWSAQLGTDMRDETLAFFREIAWEKMRPLSELLNAQVTFATPRLAALYGLPGTSSSALKNQDAVQALYLFDEGGGDILRDVSGAGEPLDLKIENPAAVKWSGGELAIKKPTRIATSNPPARLIEAVKKSGALTIEAWITPADAKQDGPARIVTLSSDSSSRNFTLGQDGGKFDARLRTTSTSTNGIPSLASENGTAAPRRTHVVFSREKSGNARLFIDGKESGSRKIDGDFKKWDDGFQLALANESTNDRPWRGTFHRVAIYSRALAPDELSGLGELSDGLEKHDVSKLPARGGLLTQGSVLTIGGDESSMVARGLFILHDLLYSAVGNAPPGTDTTPLPTKPGQSQRVNSEARLADRSCTHCHSKFEPLAFGLEKFDGIGAHREQDRHGNALREDGKILLPGTERPIEYKTSAELMDILAGSDRVRMNITRKLAQFALGRPLVESDAPALEAIHSEGWKNGGTYSSLITALALSDLIRTTGSEPARTAQNQTP